MVVIHFSKIYTGLLGATLSVSLTYLYQPWLVHKQRSRCPRPTRYLYQLACALATVATLTNLGPRLYSSFGGCTRLGTALMCFALQSAKLCNCGALYFLWTYGSGSGGTSTESPITYLTSSSSLVGPWIHRRLFGSLAIVYLLMVALQSAVIHSKYNRELVMCAPIQEYMSTTASISVEAFGILFLLTAMLWPREWTRWLAGHFRLPEGQMPEGNDSGISKDWASQTTDATASSLVPTLLTGGEEPNPIGQPINQEKPSRDISRSNRVGEIPQHFPPETRHRRLNQKHESSAVSDEVSEAGTSSGPSETIQALSDTGLSRSDIGPSPTRSITKAEHVAVDSASPSHTEPFRDETSNLFHYALAYE
ncbi:hypothetical protein H4R33_005029 [Dimargaris cristalligena]|nr:hypothetical protein H4R33_005029 [Dimargaris cristalligena]